MKPRLSRKPSTGKPMAPWRRRLFKALALLLPLLALAALELALRLAGYGFSPRFFLQHDTGGETRLTSNPRFAWRYFPPAVARTPQPLWLPQNKPPGVVRIVVLGESAAMGDPEPAYGLPRVLEALLREAYPDQPVEVINAAATAINSHAIVPIARDCRPLQADYWVVYMGNNEVVGPFGAGTVFGPRAPALGAIRATLMLRSLRLGQALETARRSVFGGEPAWWEGMEMFLEQRVAADSPPLEAVYRHFERNLRDLLREAGRAGARVMLCTVGVNLRDCAPFASLHRAGLGPGELERFTQLRQAAVQAAAEGRHREAVELWTQALNLAPTYAEAYYQRGQSRLALRQVEEARADLQAALTHDALRFRADARLNQIIRQMGRDAAPRGVRLVDVEERLAGESPFQMPGREHFWEHVHLTFSGNYAVARAIAEALAAAPDSRFAGAPKSWPAEEAVARRLAWTDWEKYQVVDQVARRLEQPPFTAQVDRSQHQQRLAQERERLKHRTTPEALREQAAAYGQALEKQPQDWVLHARYAGLWEAAGDLAAARREWEAVLQLLPVYAEAHFRLGNLADKAGEPELAERHFRAALHLRPESAEAWNGLGLSLMAQERWPEAEAALRRALQLRRSFTAAAVNLALAFNRQGRRAEGLEMFRAALRMDSQHVAAHVNLGKMLKEDGRWEAALAHYFRAVELRPDDAVARFNLANALSDLQRHEEALEHYRAAVAATPEFLEARLNYGLELARLGREAEALEQLREAARLGPQSYEARLNYGVALARQRQWSEARQEFAAAAALRPKEPAPWVSLGVVLGMLNQREEARRALETALQLDPNHPTARKHLQTLEQRR